MTEFDTAAGKVDTERPYSVYMPDMGYLVHTLLPEVRYFTFKCMCIGVTVTLHSYITLKSMSMYCFQTFAHVAHECNETP